MKILIIGGNGTIGSKVTSRLKKNHQVIVAARNNGDVKVDLASSSSIKQMYDETGHLDAVICIAGEAKWAPFSELTEEDYEIGLKSKLMGQVNLVRLGESHLNKFGSFTLSTGILADDPVVMTASAAMVNGGIHSFVRAVALELTEGHRINAVSCGLVEDAVTKYQSYFPGHNAIPMDKVVNGYIKSVEGKGTGQIFRIYD